MGQIVVGGDTKPVFAGAGEIMQIVDDQGHVLGTFYPKDAPLPVIRHGGPSWLTKEETDRRSAEPGGSSLQEIWARLKAKS